MNSFKDEKSFQTVFLAWRWEINPPTRTEVHECKYVKKGNYNIKKWFETQSHQARGLMQSKSNKGCKFKLPDDSRGQKPFDSFIIKDALAVMPIWFQEHKQFVIVNAEVMLSLTKTHKSISFDELSKLGEVHSF